MESLIVWGVLLIIFSLLVLAPCLLHKHLIKKIVTLILFFAYPYIILIISVIYDRVYHPAQTFLEALIISILYYALVDNWLDKFKKNRKRNS